MGAEIFSGRVYANFSIFIEGVNAMLDAGFTLHSWNFSAGTVYALFQKDSA